jgi:D-apiose dehydrogenase
MENAMPDDRLRLAVIGCGFFAQNHLNAWSETAGVELVAVCERDAAKAEAARAAAVLYPAAG